MHSIGAHASGLAGRGSVMTVIADAVADFKPDHILLALRSSEHAKWQEHKLGEHVMERFGLPKQVWHELFDAGRIDYHPVFPGKPGFGARAIAGEADVRDVIAIMRLNYERVATRTE